MNTALTIMWVLVFLGFCGAIWGTHDMGPASENGPIAGLIWAAWFGTLVTTSAIQLLVYLI